MRPSHALVLALGAVAVAALPTVVTRPAAACGNSVILATDANVRAVKQAEDKLNDGAPAEAAASILALKQLDFVLSPETQINFGAFRKDLLLANRAVRIFALACIRLDGSIGPWGNTKPEHRQMNVDWAAKMLKALSTAKQNDAASKTDKGEALARTSPAEAKPILEELAQKDVLATPYAYAALARLRAAAGDAAGRDEALAKCKTMAAKPGICEPAPPKPNG
jgi:hypothetical protein